MKENEVVLIKSVKLTRVWGNSWDCVLLKIDPSGPEMFYKNEFQLPLFFEIITLVTWIKSTLLLKINCFDTHIYMKTQCLQRNEI